MTDWWDEQAATEAGAWSAVWSDPDDDVDGTADRCLDLIAPHLRADAGTIVEIGCGVGRLLVPLARRYPAATVAGVDSSTRMLAWAFLRVARAGVENVELHPVEPGCPRLPFPAGAVDAAYSMLTFQHLDPLTVCDYLFELRRVLRPRGIFRFQFVDGASHSDRDHRYRRDEMAGYVTGAGLRVLSVESGEGHPDWVWATAVRP